MYSVPFDSRNTQEGILGRDQYTILIRTQWYPTWGWWRHWRECLRGSLFSRMRQVIFVLFRTLSRSLQTLFDLDLSLSCWSAMIAGGWGRIRVTVELSWLCSFFYIMINQAEGSFTAWEGHKFVVGDTRCWVVLLSCPSFYFSYFCRFELAFWPLRFFWWLVWGGIKDRTRSEVGNWWWYQSQWWCRDMRSWPEVGRLGLGWKKCQCLCGSDVICLTMIASFLTDQGQKQTEPPYFYLNQAELDTLRNGPLELSNTLFRVVWGAKEEGWSKDVHGGGGEISVKRPQKEIQLIHVL